MLTMESEPIRKCEVLKSIFDFKTKVEIGYFVYPYFFLTIKAFFLRFEGGRKILR